MADSPLRIAVVDDDASVCRALGRYLRDCSFEVATYASGREFLDSLSAFRPNCVVLDLHMEGMTGFDVQRHLSRLGARVPVIIITAGHDNPRAYDECIALGAGALITKPVEGPLLVSTIERVVGEAHPNQ